MVFDINFQEWEKHHYWVEMCQLCDLEALALKMASNYNSTNDLYVDLHDKWMMMDGSLTGMRYTSAGL